MTLKLPQRKARNYQVLLSQFIKINITPMSPSNDPLNRSLYRQDRKTQLPKMNEVAPGKVEGTIGWVRMGLTLI